ncbi:HNH endonuclease [Candidatus Poriferisodalis sp.]|uniref:HNH endonuclease signature motif containing protein n=1 Tax=Candidatus Poriferisodalis sp. TaxID=3101277 RepID=UPI003B5A4E80
MFGDVVRELAPGCGEASGAGIDTASGRPPAGSAWPDEAAIWTGGKFGAFEDVASSADERNDPLGAVSGVDDARRHGAAEAGTADGIAAAGDIDLGALSSRELKDLVVELAAERARIEGRFVAAVGEMASRNGAQSAAYVLRDQTRMNCAQARSESRLAESLVSEGLTDTLEAMQAGEIQLSHAKVIAREAPKKHRRSEAEFIELCRVYPSDTIARHPLAFQSQQAEADLAAEAAAEDLSPLDAELALQRHERSASLRMGDDGMWHLRGKFDFLAGRQLSEALQAAVRSMRRRHSDNSTDGSDDPDGGSGDAPSRAQLTADALCELLLGTSAARRANSSLIIVADYDLTSDRLANPRLDDGTPLSAQMLVEHAIDAKVLPAMFSTDWSELALGRTRNANDAQRLVLAVRDGGCIGCELTSEHTQAHHIDYFEHGGPTEVPNLASLCEPCHRDVHTHGRKIHTPPDGRPQLQPPDPSNTGPPARAPTAAPASARSP